MKVISSGGEVSEADVQSLEARLGHLLPRDYRDFLLSRNAREIRPCVLPTPNLERSKKVVLRPLACFSPKTGSDFGYLLATYEGRIPKAMLPVGSDPGGNLFLMDLWPERLGRIYFWERAFEADEGDEPTTRNITEIAEGFSDLLSRLVDD